MVFFDFLYNIFYYDYLDDINLGFKQKIKVILKNET